MSTIELIDHLTTIFMDVVMPVLVLWIGFQLRGWISKEEHGSIIHKAKDS